MGSVDDEVNSNCDTCIIEDASMMHSSVNFNCIGFEFVDCGQTYKPILLVMMPLVYIQFRILHLKKW